jgi:hypothetical protein
MADYLPFGQAVRRLAPHVTLTDTGDYLRWTLSLRNDDHLAGSPQFWGSTGPGPAGHGRRPRQQLAP